MKMAMANKEDDEEIRYVIEPHNVRPKQKVVTVYCGNELICSFYMHSYENRQFCVFMSKYLGEVYTDLKNPMAPGLIIELSQKK